MQFLKYIILVFIFAFSVLIGRIVSKKYFYRLQELEEMKNSLNVFKSKIKFTYEPIPEIFDELARTNKTNIKNIFASSSQKMKDMVAGDAWAEAVKEADTNCNEEDINVILMLSKLLGQTDIEGQISQIDVTNQFLDNQIKHAQEEKIKNEKLYSKLGITIGLAIVVILI